MQEKKLSFQEKILKHRLTTIYRIALGIVLLVAVVLVIRIQIENKVYTDFEIVRSAESVSSEDSIAIPYNNHVLYYSRDGISAYDSDGEQLWNQTYEMQSPIVSVAGEYVVAGDYKGNTIYIMDAKGPCQQITINKVLLDVSVSEMGAVTATLDDDTTTWLDIYNAKGESVVSIKTSMNQSGFPLTTSMSQDNQKMAVAYLKAEGSGIGTSIAFYNFGDVGQNVTDKIVSGFDYEDMVIPFLHYINDNDAVAVGENKLLIYGGKQIPELRAEVTVEEGIKSVYFGDSLVALVYVNDESEDKYRLDVYDLNAKQVLSKTFDMEYSNIVLDEGNIIIYNEAMVTVWNKKGLEKYNGDLGGGIKTVIPTGSATKFLVVRNEGMDLIKLK